MWFTLGTCSFIGFHILCCHNIHMSLCLSEDQHVYMVGPLRALWISFVSVLCFIFIILFMLLCLCATESIIKEFTPWVSSNNFTLICIVHSCHTSFSLQMLIASLILLETFYVHILNSFVPEQSLHALTIAYVFVPCFNLFLVFISILLCLEYIIDL